MATPKNTPRAKVNATLDRIEGNTAVLDADGFALTVPRDWLPAGANEGDGFQITIVPHEMHALGDSVRKRLDALTKKRPR
jgi:hypothetical protein